MWFFTKKKGKNIKHIALDLGMNDSIEKSLSNIDMLIKLQIEKNITIVTLRFMKSNSEEISKYLDKLSRDPFIHKNKIHISILGKWYSLPGMVIDSVKRVIEETKDYDNFFFNICINYDGQEEIVDACKLIANKVLANKMSLKEITKEVIKDNIYSSYFVPPDAIIYTKGSKGGFLLWDSAQSKLFYSSTSWSNFRKEDLLRIIERC